MRFWSSTALLVPIAAIGSAARSSSSQEAQHIQVYLHPSPSSPHSSAPTLSADQAKAVLSHHLGEAISDFDEIPADEGLWGHLVGMWGGHGIGRQEAGARVVIVDGGVGSQTILPTSLKQEPSFYLDADDDAESLFSPYTQRAKTFFNEVLSNLPDYVKDFVDGLEMAGTTSVLHQELSTLIALSEKEVIPYLSNLRTSTWEAVRISGLAHFKEGSDEYEEGAKSVKAGLAAMTQPNSPPLMVVIMPHQAHFHSRRDLPIQVQKFNESKPICYTSESSCSDATSCNERGSCSLLGKTGDKDCWGCKCASGYAGSECQKVDYTIPFVILVFSAIMLVALVGGSVALLWTVGETKLPSTLTLAVGHAKRD